MPLAESVLVSIAQEVKFRVVFCGANIGWSEVRDGIHHKYMDFSFATIWISPSR